MTTTLIYKQTCRICEMVKDTTLTVLLGIWQFGEACGRARAAAQLHRDGFHKEARALMLNEHKNDG